MLIARSLGLFVPAPVSRTFVAGASVSPQNNAFAGGTVTFSGLNGGTNFPKDALVIVGVIQDQDATTLTSPQIGGNAASIVAGAQDSSTRCTFYQAVMAAASTDNFTFTNGSAVGRIAVVSCYLTGMNSAVSAASNETYGSSNDPQTPAASITVPTNGFGIAFVGSSNSNLIAPNAVTWTNCVAAGGDVNTGPDTFITQASLAHTATPGSWLPTCTPNTIAFNFIAGMSVAAWGP